MKVIELLEATLENAKINLKDFTEIIVKFWTDRGLTEARAKYKAKSLMDNYITCNLAYKDNVDSKEIKAYAIEQLRWLYLDGSIHVWENGDLSLSYQPVYPMTFISTWKQIYRAAGLGVFKK